jgi:hypothetical protein
MATFLDITALGYFSSIFSFLFIWVIVFAVLEKVKIFGSNKGIHAIIGLSLAVLVLLSKTVTAVIAMMAPWFVLIFVFMLLVMMASMFLGASEQGVLKTLGEKETGAITWILIIGIIVVLGSLGMTFFSKPITGDAVNATTNTTVTTGGVGGIGSSAVWATFLHPKVLGLVFLLLIATFTIRELATSPK